MGPNNITDVLKECFPGETAGPWMISRSHSQFEVRADSAIDHEEISKLDAEGA